MLGLGLHVCEVFRSFLRCVKVFGLFWIISVAAPPGKNVGLFRSPRRPARMLDYRPLRRPARMLDYFGRRAA
jgi:hypothetical protein